jgi:phosphoenolpyruvate-protein phosphotransferase (PTS system enzyme I)
MQEKRKLKIINELGMHARAAGKIVELARQYKSKVVLKKNGREADGASILSILSLACPAGSEIEVFITGDDAKEFMDDLERLFKDHFGENSKSRYRSKKKTLKGFPVSPGVVFGRAHHLDRYKTTIFRRRLFSKNEISSEIDRFREAVENTREQIKKLKSNIPVQVRGYSFILDTHLMMLDDSELFDSTLKKIRKDRINAEWALEKSVNRVRHIFKTVGNDYIGGRMDDVDSVGERILRHLTGVDAENLASIKKEAIVIAHRLSPCDIVEMNVDNVMGILTDVGGKTSHMAIMSEALEIPVVVGLENATDKIIDGDILIVDGNVGDVIINPDPETIIAYEERKKQYNVYKSAIYEATHLPAETLDGRKIKIKANIEFSEEVSTAIKNGAEGIGLYRTEYLYMVKRDFPDEETLFNDYKNIAAAIAPHSVTIRTLDIASDNIISNKNAIKEQNPALGFRSIRFCLKEKDVFRTQLRAILRASAFGKIRVMFPMISGLPQFLEAKRILKAVMRSLDKQGIHYNRDIPIGILLEIPSAISIANILAKHADFFSIGTNDLIQYALAIDRDNEHVAHLYEPFHPAVLKMVQEAVKAAKKEKIGVSICGEIAGDPLAILILLFLGLEEFSMNVGSIPTVKKIIRALPLAEITGSLKGILDLPSSDRIEKFVLKKARSMLPDIFKQDLFKYRTSGY